MEFRKMLMITLYAEQKKKKDTDLWNSTKFLKCSWWEFHGDPVSGARGVMAGTQIQFPLVRELKAHKPCGTVPHPQHIPTKKKKKNHAVDTLLFLPRMQL